jgi:ferritin
LACVRAALAHEQAVTMRIHALYTIAEESDDSSACVFLHWFIQEQVEEEASLDELITRLELAAECTSGLLALDAEYRNALAN